MTSSIVLAQDWAKNAPSCPRCGPPETVLYICFSLNCHPPGQQLYCLDCQENDRHVRPSVRIDKSVKEMLDNVTKQKEKTDQLNNGAQVSFKKYSSLIKFIESKFVQQQVQGHRIISKDAVDIISICNEVYEKTLALETMSKEKKIKEFLTFYSEIDILYKKLVPFQYLEELNEDFLYTNYLTHWPIEVKSSDNISMEDQVRILNLNLRFVTSQLSQMKPGAQ